MMIKIKTSMPIEDMLSEIRDFGCNLNGEDGHKLKCSPDCMCRKDCRVVSIEIKKVEFK